VAQYETSLAVPELQATGDSPESVTDDRRRPGRPSLVNPTLVPLLRGDLPSSLTLSNETELVEDRGALAPAIAVAVALAMRVPLWGAIGFAAWALSR
jgi:hypothetical protein